MSLIDTTYFIGEINIAQISQAGVSDVVPAFIQKYESKFLNEALGYGFAKLFNEGLATDPIAVRWSNLRDGAEYNNQQGFLRKWDGFIDSANKNSIIANYVYYWYLRDNSTITTAMGEVIPATENGTVSTPAVKMARAWNEMDDAIQVLHDYLLNARDVNNNLIYPEFDINQVTRLGRLNPFGL